MVNEYIKLWLKERQWTRETKAWLRHNDERIVANAMFHLNHLAPHLYGEKRMVIYQLKNRLVETLYKRGFCKRVTQEKQTFECWDCDGTGEDYDGDSCWKCAGTGTYREHTLYRFVFEIHGRWYVWHQPARYVTWEVETRGEVGQFQGGQHSVDSSHYKTAHLYIRLIHAYLRQCGIPASELPKGYRARDMVRDLWHDTRLYRRWRWHIRPVLQDRLYNLKRLIHYINTGSWEIEEIPF